MIFYSINVYYQNEMNKFKTGKSGDVHGNLTPSEKLLFMHQKLEKVKTKEMNIIRYS